MNKCLFSGRLVADAELRYTKNGTSVSNFVLAVESGYGEYKRTDFPRFEMWNQENLAKYLTKGKAIIVTESTMKDNKFTDKSGQERKNVVFVAKNVEFQQGSPSTEKETQNNQKQDNENMDVDPFAMEKDSPYLKNKSTEKSTTQYNDDLNVDDVPF